MIKTQWYLVRFHVGGILRMQAPTADLARQRATFTHKLTVKSVELDPEQHPNPVEDY